jgi:hypothetical protein
VCRRNFPLNTQTPKTKIQRTKDFYYLPNSECGNNFQILEPIQPLAVELEIPLSDHCKKSILIKNEENKSQQLTCTSGKCHRAEYPNKLIHRAQLLHLGAES